jgi:hypothetical protein
MFFSPTYGNLGLFFLPINFIAVLSIMIIFFIMVWNYLSSVISNIWRLSLVGWDLSVVFSLDPRFLFSNLVTTPLFLGLIGLALGGYILYISFKLDNSNKSNKPGYLIYLIFFPIVLMAFWSLALVFEAFRAKRNW